MVIRGYQVYNDSIEDSVDSFFGPSGVRSSRYPDEVEQQSDTCKPSKVEHGGLE